MSNSPIDLLPVLHELFGFDSFNPGQERVIRALLAGRDVLAVMPTGGGKSLVYQLTSQLLPGLTVVVSPLLALMKDQVDALEHRGIGVSLVNSLQAASESIESWTEVTEGTSKLLYVTPERFDDDAFMIQLHGQQVSLLVVDEAHCVSDWGHSFRPAYLGIAAAAQRLGRPPILALTATATPWIRQEIIDRLQLRKPDVVVRGSDRSNLFFEVRRVEYEYDDKQVLHNLLVSPPDNYGDELDANFRAIPQGSGIIYVATTKAARETAAWLQGWGISADYYHGQRKKAERERVQEAFMDGSLRVIAATNAFGMGVDKPDVRFVIHRDIPASLEAYMQEAGRAGRDGKPARCTLIYRPADLGRAAFLSAGGELTADEVVAGHHGLLRQREGTLRELQAATGLSRADLVRFIALLKDHKLVTEKRGRIKLLVDDFDPATISLEGEAHRRAYEQSRLDMMRGYAETHECRRCYILNYFGEEYDQPTCQLCDNDLLRTNDPRVIMAEEVVIPSPFRLGERVLHATWGPGVVQRITNDSLIVLFETVGYKTLAADVVQERELLVRAM